jgi:hypothetical protein
MRYQGQEYYDVAVREVIVNAARADPDAASRLLLPASPTVQREAAQQVALALAEQDPRAAAAWAQSVIDPRARSSAQFSVAGTWYSSDPEGARRYVLAQPEGVERDLVLSNLVQIAASSGSVDQALMDGFSSDVMRQQAMSIATAAQARFKP